MLRAFFLTALLFVHPVLAQTNGPLVTVAQLDAAIEQASASRAENDPARLTLVKTYSDIRAALADIEEYQGLLKTYSEARTNAAQEARSIETGLAEREGVADQDGPSLARITLQELEPVIQVNKAELDAGKSRLASIGGDISGMAARANEIRNRLTELGSLLPQLGSRLGLMSRAVDAGTQGEANLWLLEVQQASAAAEKAALDEELLSQPVRLELRKAQQDQVSYDIAVLERRLAAMERRASELRQGAASDAHVQAEKAAAATQGKHPLIQRLADANAALTGSFSERGVAIENTRQRDMLLAGQAERLEGDFEAIERKLDILGMSAAVGEILREQQIQLPKRQESRREISNTATDMSETSIRLLELEEERRKLRDADSYVDQLSVGQDPQVAAAIRGDLLELARDRRKLVEQAVALETTYSSALGNLEYSLRRYAWVVDIYRDFISERLFWIPSRNPFTVFRGSALPDQAMEILNSGSWREVMGQLPVELVKQPLTIAALLLALLLIYSGPRLRIRVAATGRDVGYVRTDLYSNTMLALALSFILSLRWPLLMLVFAWLFEMQESESELATALFAALSRGALYFWGLEFLRALLMPKGLMDAHFRWPVKRTNAMCRRILRLEQTFVPAALVVIFTLALHPREVGGALGALGTIILLLSISHFFRHMPHFMQDKMTVVLSDNPSHGGTNLGKIARFLLVWVPLVATVAVLFGYIYTAIELSLLLIQTIVLFCVILLVHELGLRWLRMTRRRMVVKARAEAALDAGNEGETGLDEEPVENDSELLSYEGTKLLNVLTLIAGLVGIFLIWAEVFPALGILDSIQLWHQTGVVDGVEAPVPVTLEDVLGAMAIAAGGWIALRRIPSLLEIMLRQKMSVHPATAYAATRVISYAATAALVVLVLGLLGGAWSQIQWAVAALSVGIGFGLQEIVANFISGLIILFEQPVRVGDTVTVGGVSGKVTKIRIRATTIRDFDRRELLVPNKEFITQQLLNWSLSDQVTRWVLEVGVAYGTDLDKAMAVVREAAHRQPLVLSDPEPLVTFDQFGDSSLLIRLRFFMDQLDQRLVVASDLMLDINRHLTEQGIVVSFPQRDVHLDTSAPLEVRVVAPEQERGS